MKKYIRINMKWKCDPILFLSNCFTVVLSAYKYLADRNPYQVRDPFRFPPGLTTNDILLAWGDSPQKINHHKTTTTCDYTPQN